MLRWRSEDALRIYARINNFAYADWLTSAQGASVSSIRTTTGVLCHPLFVRSFVRPLFASSQFIRGKDTHGTHKARVRRAWDARLEAGRVQRSG